MAKPPSHDGARRSPVTRTTTFSKLPDWLSRCDVRQYVGILLASADALIHRLPHHRFGKHIRVSKHLLAPEPQLYRELILGLLRDPTYQHRALLLKEVRTFLKAHGRGSA